MGNTALFLSKEEQQYTEPIIMVGLYWLPEETDLLVLTRRYYDNCTEYYLFNKIRIWKKRTRK